VIEAIDGKWLVEAPELSGLGKADVEHLKATLSRGADRARRPYERLSVDVPRQSVIVGTTNESSYLRDTTGNRRFLPVRIDRFDIAAIERDKDQLWAEAAHFESAGASIRLPAELWHDAQNEQLARVVEDPFFEILLSKFGDDGPSRVLATQVWGLLDREPGKQSQADNKRMGEAMRRLGFTRKRLRASGSPAYWYVRGNDDAAPPFDLAM
jgi:predicted P-loop ATPase